MLRLFARGWPWLFVALSACGPQATPAPPATTPAPLAAKCKCAPAMNDTIGDCTDLRLYMTIGDGRCEPTITTAGLRCLPKFPYWDAGGRFIDTPAGSELPYPDLSPPPLYVLGLEYLGDRNAITSVWFIPATAQRVCTDMKGCVLRVPLSKDALRVPLAWFGDCTR